MSSHRRVARAWEQHGAPSPPGGVTADGDDPMVVLGWGKKRSFTWGLLCTGWDGESWASVERRSLEALPILAPGRLPPGAVVYEDEGGADDLM